MSEPPALISNISAAWQDDFDAGGEFATGSVAGAPTGMTVWCVLPNKDSAHIEAGLDVLVAPNVLLSANYIGGLSGRQQSHAGSGFIAVNF